MLVRLTHGRSASTLLNHRSRTDAILIPAEYTICCAQIDPIDQSGESPTILPIIMRSQIKLTFIQRLRIPAIIFDRGTFIIVIGNKRTFIWYLRKKYFPDKCKALNNTPVVLQSRISNVLELLQFIAIHGNNAD